MIEVRTIPGPDSSRCGTVVSPPGGSRQAGEPVPGPGQQLRHVRAGAEPGPRRRTWCGSCSMRTGRCSPSPASRPRSTAAAARSRSRSWGRIELDRLGRANGCLPVTFPTVTGSPRGIPRGASPCGAFRWEVKPSFRVVRPTGSFPGEQGRDECPFP
jgi:hypothetical protein